MGKDLVNYLVIDDHIKFSIITPTYNREALLPKLAQSLKYQGKYILEWIIIDDASTDGTKNLVNTFRDEFDFKIKYIYNPVNRGMVHSLNIAFSLVKGNYFFKIDSDDYLLPNAMNDIYSTISNCREIEKSGVIYAYSFFVNNKDGLCLNNASKLISNVQRYSEDIYIASYVSCRSSHWVTGDLLDVFPSRPVLDHFRYPIYSSDKHCPSGLISYFLADYCKTNVLYNLNPVLVKDYQTKGISYMRKTKRTNTLSSGPSSYLSASLWELLINKRNSLAYINSWRRFIRTIFSVMKFQLITIIRTIRDKIL